MKSLSKDVLYREIVHLPLFLGKDFVYKIYKHKGQVK